MQDICLKTKSNVFLLLPSWMWKLKCEKATTNLLNHYYWWISSDCDKEWSSNKILSVAHVARHDSWWASIFWAFVRVLSFGGFIIQLSRSLLSTSQPAGGEPASDFRPSTQLPPAARKTLLPMLLPPHRRHQRQSCTGTVWEFVRWDDCQKLVWDNSASTPSWMITLTGWRW